MGGGGGGRGRLLKSNLKTMAEENCILFRILIN